MASSKNYIGARIFGSRIFSPAFLRGVGVAPSGSLRLLAAPVNAYARSASQAKYPSLWRELFGAWSPCVGITGVALRDRSGRSNHGVLTGMDPATDWVMSEGKRALDFDGTDYVDCGDLSLSSNSGAYSVWVNVTSVTEGAVAAVVTTSDAGTSNRVRLGVYKTSGVIYPFFDVTTSAGTHYSHYGSTALSTAAWYHLVLTHVDGFAPQLYVNAILQSLTNVGTVDLDNTKWWHSLAYTDGNTIGAHSLGSVGGFFSGLIDDQLTYTRGLSFQDVWQLSRRRGIVHEMRQQIFMSPSAVTATTNRFRMLLGVGV